MCKSSKSLYAAWALVRHPSRALIVADYDVYITFPLPYQLPELTRVTQCFRTDVSTDYSGGQVYRVYMTFS